jgi:hypothetical protein
MVSKGRHVGGFGGDDFNFPEDQIILATDFLLDEQGRTLQIRATGGYPGITGGLVLLGVKSGKSVEVGEIASIGADGTLLVKELEGDLFWNRDFVIDLKKTDQKIFAIFPAPHVQRLLGIELSIGLGFSGGNLTIEPVPVDSIFLDMDGNDIITVAEVEAFVEKTKALIARPEGLSLGALVPGIPPRLRVTGVDLSGTGPTVEETLIFNEFVAQVKVVDGKQFVYVQWTEDAPPGVRVNNWGDVDQFVEFDDFMKEIRDIVKPYLYGPADEQPWTSSSLYIDVVDKARETMVARGEKIKSIKKVKKCGKRYYKLELEDTGFVSNVQRGRFDNCIVRFIAEPFEPFGM